MCKTHYAILDTVLCPAEGQIFWNTTENEFVHLLLDLVQKESWKQFTLDAVPVKSYSVDCHEVHQYKYITFIPDSSFR